MISIQTGNLFKSKAEAWVNAVNTVGVMGAGIAKEFKTRFPDNFIKYQAWCEQQGMPGKIFVFDNGSNPRLILNFATKQHWRYPSKVEWIRDGLQELREIIGQQNISSIALPALGCGLGGLKFETVKELVFSELGCLETDVELYSPV